MPEAAPARAASVVGRVLEIVRKVPEERSFRREAVAVVLWPSSRIVVERILARFLPLPLLLDAAACRPLAACCCTLGAFLGRRCVRRRMLLVTWGGKGCGEANRHVSGTFSTSQHSDKGKMIKQLNERHRMLPVQADAAT